MSPLAPLDIDLTEAKAPEFAFQPVRIHFVPPARAPESPRGRMMRRNTCVAVAALVTCLAVGIVVTGYAYVKGLL